MQNVGEINGGTTPLLKTGAGALLVSGANGFTAGTILGAGTLRLTGTLACGVTATNGVFSASGSAAGPLALSAPGTFQPQINGASPGSSYDQLIVSGPVTLGGSLNTVTTNAAALVNSSSYIVIRNDSVSAVSGTFAGLPQLATLTNGALVWRVNYQAGDGNDVALTLLSGGAPATAPPVPVTLIHTGAVWKYFDQTNDLGTAWRGNAFNDATWSSGPAMLGFGDANGIFPSTVIASNRQWTTYFRRAFYVPDASKVQSLAARIQRDDGAVVYLNGTEIWRDTNMPAGTITNTTPALSALGTTNETLWLPLNLPPSTLSLVTSGSNQLAIEVHQNAITSSDLAMNFELTGTAIVSTNTSLALNLNGANLSLSWPADAGIFSLYSTTNLTLPVTWVIATNSDVLSNNQWRVAIPAVTNGQRFYRLQAP